MLFRSRLNTTLGKSGIFLFIKTAVELRPANGAGGPHVVIYSPGSGVSGEPCRNNTLKQCSQEQVKHDLEIELGMFPLVRL